MKKVGVLGVELTDSGRQKQKVGQLVFPATECWLSDERLGGREAIKRSRGLIRG